MTSAAISVGTDWVDVAHLIYLLSLTVESHVMFMV